MPGQNVEAPDSTGAGAQNNEGGSDVEAALKRELVELKQQLIRTVREESGFHVTGGWYFRHQPDGGGVIVEVWEDGISKGLYMDPATWASVITEVSARPDATTWELADKLHRGIVPEVMTSEETLKDRLGALWLAGYEYAGGGAVEEGDEVWLACDEAVAAEVSGWLVEEWLEGDEA